MLNLIRLAAAVSVVCFLSSCYSKIHVRVDAFDMDKMYKSGEYHRRQIQLQISSYDKSLASPVFAEIRQIMSDSVRNALGAMENFDQSQLSGVMVLVDSAISAEINTVKQQLATKRASFQRLLTLEGAEYQQLYEASQTPLIVQLDGIVKYVGELLSEAGVRDRAVIQRLQSIAGSVEVAATKLGIFGNTITDDQMASFIAKAPEEFWAKYDAKFYQDENNLTKTKEAARINETKVTTFVGNSDIAIKMDAPGSFVIKGVRLDADQAFRTSFKVLSQSIQYFSGIAMAGGAPKTGGGSSGGGGAEMPSLPELENLDANKQQAAALVQEHERLTNTFLSILANYQKDMNDTDATKRKAAIQAVKQAYNYYKSQLTVQ